jgi:hypothetical protein
MGVEMKKRTVKWGPETFAEEADMMEAFSPFAQNPSHLSRVVYRIMHKIIRTRGILEVIADHLQDSLRPTSSDAQLSIEFPAAAPHTPLTGRAKPPVRIASRRSADRGAVSAIKRSAGVVGRVGLCAYPSSFPASLLRPYLFNSTRFMRRAA